MPETARIEQLLGARRIDVDSTDHVAACCADHAIVPDKLMAMIEVFRPLSESFALFVTK